MIRTPEQLLQLKRELYSALTERHRASIADLETGIAELQKAANEETKSSVGDKYETGRAMIQLEIEKLALQLSALRQSESLISGAKPGAINLAAQLGSVVETSNGNFYLTYNGGQIHLSDLTFICISLQSPLGKLLLGSTEGKVVNLNGRAVTILKVF